MIEMVKAKRELVFATFILSGLAVIASFVALGTENWAAADVIIQTKYSSVNYGLFSGLYTRRVATAGTTYELAMTCLMSENVCAMLCESTSDERSSTLKKLHNNESPSFGCVNDRRLVYEQHIPIPREGSSDERDFINAGLWIGTIVFLALSCAAGLGATVLAMWNTVYNPIEVYFNIVGLYIWNGIASLFCLLTMVMYGILFAVTLVENICVFDTIQNPDVRSGNAVLHFSYWLNLVALILYVASMVVLAVRQHLINKEPAVTHTIDDSADPGLLIY